MVCKFNVGNITSNDTGLLLRKIDEFLVDILLDSSESVPIRIILEVDTTNDLM